MSMRGTRFLPALFSALLPALCGAPLSAHDLNTSYTEIFIDPDKSQVVLSLVLDEADLETLFHPDSDSNRTISDQELQTVREAALLHVRDSIYLGIGAADLVFTPRSCAMENDELGNRFARFVFESRFDRTPWQVRLRIDIFGELARLHKNLVRISCGPDEVQQAILTRGYNEETFYFRGGTGFVFAQIAQFFWLGVEHIFTGYDHILFLLGLILLGGSLANLVKMVTAFTVAHSATLILAALQVVSIPSRLVESVIAFSIVYVAVENFFTKEGSQRWVIAFLFGLMHGFGFANVLVELGLPTRGLVTSLLFFNVGVEVGQLVIVAVTFPLIALVLRTKWKQRFIYGISACIFVFGLIWFVERAFDLDLPFV